jgi:outer membrane autotransporter protein
MRRRGVLNYVSAAAIAIVAIHLLTPTPANAQEAAIRAVQSALRSALTSIRDRIRRKLAEEEEIAGLVVGSKPDASVITPTADIVEQPQDQGPDFGLWLEGSVEREKSEVEDVDTTTDTWSVTGGGDVTHYGIFSDSDALTIGLIGLFSKSDSEDEETESPGVGAYLAYVTGTLAFQLSATGVFSESDVEGMPDDTESEALIITGSVSNTFELPDSWFIEPTVEVTYTESFIEDAEDGEQVQLLGSLRIGTEIDTDGVKVIPSLTGAAFSNIHVEPDDGPTDEGQLWLHGTGKIEFVFSDALSAHIQGDVKGTEGDVDILAYGASAGVNVSF